MGLPTFDDLFQRIDARRPAIAVVAAGGADPTVLVALNEAQQRGWVRPVVTGRADEIREVANRERLSLEAFRVVDTETPAETAVALIRAGEAACLMKGQIPTPELMKGVLSSERGLKSGRVIGQIVLMEIPRDGRVFLMADTGICIAPTLEQKLDLAKSACEIARALGIARPAVALMAATEKVHPQMPDTLDAEEIVRRADAGELGECRVAGPLSFDLAYAVEAGQRKKLEGDVLGAADILLFPNLLSANLTVKAIMYTADCRFGGVLCGTTAPVVFMSRADSVETRLRSLAYTLTLAFSGN
jgi:phosphate butyryltransferase